jgi:DNA polymerase-3 subunit alpha (Gram-positive type)
MADSIVSEREKGEFFSVEDLHERTKISKNALDSLEKNGCFDGMRQSSQMGLFD